MKNRDYHSTANPGESVSLVLSGSSGMGAVYLQALLENLSAGLFRVEGVVDPFPEGCPHLDRLHALGIPIYSDLESFYRRHPAEFAIISSPIRFHSEQTCLALKKGSHVLCEKPVAATIQDARLMARVRDRAKRWVAIGYQWSFSTAILSLKTDILNGLFGKPKRLKCLYLWPRDEVYYRRNDWAGKLRDRSGAWILDSPANNAMAHDLHNMFYVLGDGRDRSAVPVEVEAELYRAYNIENFDTAAVRCRLDSGVEILFYVSHASAADKGPVFLYEFEKGEVFGSGRGSDIQARFPDGSVKKYGSPDNEPMKKLWVCLEAVKTGRPPVCGIEAAMSQTLALNGMQDSMPEIAGFPRHLIGEANAPGQRRIWVEGLDDILERCYEKNQLPSESDVPWSRKGRRISLRDYREFPSVGG